MAFRVRPALRGKHRRRQPGRTAATLAGVAVIAGAGAFGATALAAPDHPHTAAAAATVKKNVLTQASSVSGSLANSFSAQADVQRAVANTAHEQADQARAEAAAKAKAAAEARAKAAAEAKARAAAAAKAKAKAASARAAAAKAAAAKAAALARSAPATQAPTTAVTKAAAGAGSGWTKPVDAPIGTPYHQAGSNWSSGYHTGVDFLVSSGTPVHAVAAGVVVSAGPDGAYGNDVIIKHADGMYTLYGHLTEPLVSAGQTVTEGQEIGISGATGNVTGPHLHFEVRTTPDYGSDVDPVAYLAKHGVTV